MSIDFAQRQAEMIARDKRLCTCGHRYVSHSILPDDKSCGMEVDLCLDCSGTGHTPTGYLGLCDTCRGHGDAICPCGKFEDSGKSSDIAPPHWRDINKGETR